MGRPCRLDCRAEERAGQFDQAETVSVKGSRGRQRSIGADDGGS